MADERTRQESGDSVGTQLADVPAERASVGFGLLALLGGSPVQPPKAAPEASPAGCDALPRIPIAAPAWRAVGADRSDPPPLVAPHPREFAGPIPGSVVHACCQLDASKDDLWTSEGLPRLDALERLLGHPVEREQVNASWPGFTRGRARQGIVGAPAREPEPTLSDADSFRAGGELDFQRRLQRQHLADLEHAALGPFAHRVPRPDFRCPIDRRIAAENRNRRRQS